MAFPVANIYAFQVWERLLQRRWARSVAAALLVCTAVIHAAIALDHRPAVALSRSCARRPGARRKATSSSASAVRCCGPGTLSTKAAVAVAVEEVENHSEHHPEDQPLHVAHGRLIIRSRLTNAESSGSSGTIGILNGRGRSG